MRLLIPLLTLFNVSVWGTDYDDVATFDSDDVVTNSSYDTYQNDNWYLSKGGNNVSGGFNSSNKVTIGNAYGTSANTSHHGFYILSKNKLSKICKITFEYTGGSNTSGAKLYLGYSTDGSSWSAVTLTTGSQGMSVGSTSTEYTMIFSEISSAYYALIVSANGTLSSKNAFRFDNITAVFYQEDVPAVPYTVTFNAEGGDCETSSLTEENAGDGVELPEATTDCSSDGWAFYGWATSACSSSIGTAPTIVGKAGDTYYPADDITLHAVFAKGEYTKETSSITSGCKYLIVAASGGHNHIMKSSSDDFQDYSGYNGMAAIQIDETSSGKYHAAAIDATWCYTIEGTAGNYFIRDVVNSSSSNYADIAYASWWGHAIDNGDKYTITVSSGIWTIKNNYYNSGYSYLGYDSSDDAFFAYGSAKDILLYKETTTPAYFSSPTCCDKPTALTKGSISLSSQTVSWTAPSSAPAGGYYVAYSTATSSDPGNDVYSTSGNYTVMAISTGTTTANIPCNSAGTYNWWVRSKCSSSDNTSCSGWVKGAAFTMNTLYLKTNSTWRADNAYFAAYFWDATTNGWTPAMSSQTDCETGVYKVVFPAAYTSMKFVRLNPAYSTPSFETGHVWNETANLTIPANKDCFTLPDGASSGTGNGDGNANWSVYARKYQIDFDLNKPSVFTSDPSTAPAARCVATGTTTDAPTNAQAMGKQITGWYKEAGCSNQWVFASQQVSGNQTLYAKWEDVSNKTIYLDCSATLSGSKTWDADNTVLFARAYINGTQLATEVKMTSAVSTCDAHVYAFSIPGNATHVSFARCATGTTELPANWASNPPVYNAITGKTVESGKDWYKVTDWGSADLDNSPFAATTYTISYNKGSATYAGGNTIDGSKSNETKNCDIAFTLPSSAVFSAEGYTQTSWATSDGGSSAYSLGGSYTSNADQAFYPVWTINSHTLTWNWGGGSTSSDSYTAGGTVNYGATITYPANNTMSKTGYDFSSWSTDATTMPDNDLTITASWTIHTHKVSVASVSNATITATPAGGSAIAEGSNNGSVNYGTTVTLNWPTPDTHYSNITWDVYKDGDSSTKVAVSGSGNGATFTLPDYDVIVSATAVEDAYKTVCFKNNGVGITGYDAQKVYVGSSPSQPTLTDGLPASGGNACDETSDKHYGWTKTTWNSTIATKSALDERTGAEAVYAKSATLPVVANEDPSTIYYHAVWAEGSGVEPTLPSTIVYWAKTAFDGANGVSATTGTGTLTSNVSLSTSSNRTYQSTISKAAVMTISDIDISDYDYVRLSFWARGSAGGTISIKTNLSETPIATTSALTGDEVLYVVDNVPNTATSITMTYSASSGSFFFGTVKLVDINTSDTYSFTKLTSSNTSGWSTTDWDGYYLITNDQASLKALDGNAIGATSYISVSPSDGVITNGILNAFKVEYNSTEEKYSVQGVGDGTYINYVNKGIGYASSAQYHAVFSYNALNNEVSDKLLSWNSSGSKFGFYGSIQTSAPQMYKILTSYSTFRTTCCTTYDITLDGGGTISGAGTFSAGVDAACATETITLTKDICDGYTVGDWTVHKTDDESTTVTVTSNQFTMPAYDVTVKLSTTAKVDHFKDNMHKTTGYTGDGMAVSGCDQTVPTISDKGSPADESCKATHYKFVGWVDEDYVDTDGTLKTGYSIVSGSTTDWDATGTTYIAIWGVKE